MRTDSLEVTYDNILGGTRAKIHPPSGPFYSMGKQVEKGNLPVEEFRSRIICAAKLLAAEISEIEEGVDLKIDVEVALNDLLDRAKFIPSDDWLRRYALINLGRT